jgi:hypothetical protein
VAPTLKRRIDHVLTYLRHPITNALNESLNAQVEKVKRRASGYRNRLHFHTAIISTAADWTSILDHNIGGLPTVIPDDPFISQ